MARDVRITDHTGETFGENGKPFKIEDEKSKNAIEGLQTTDETIQDIIDRIGELQNTNETLQSIVDRIGELQNSNETLQSIIDKIDEVKQQLDTAGADEAGALLESLEDELTGLSSVTDAGTGERARAIVDVAPWGYEEISEGIVGIETNHARVHQGEAFAFNTVFSDLTDGSTEWVIFETGGSVDPLIHLQGLMAQGCRIRLWRSDDPPSDIFGYDLTNADEIIPVNLNMDSSNTTEVTIHEDPDSTTTTDANIFRVWYMDYFMPGQEVILLPDQGYGFEITNISGETIDVHIEGLWYEVDNSE